MIRARLVQFACELDGDSPGRDELVGVAAALEFLHALLLIHDDIIDRSLLRRGGESFNR